MAFKRRISMIAAVAALPLALAACGDAAEEAPEAETAEAGEPSVIEARQANFEGLGDAFKVIRDQLESDAPDLALITASAETINANAQKITTSDWFVEGTSVDSGADTEALPAIWDQTEEFEAAAANLVTKSEAMLAAAQSGDAAAVGANVMELGGACKNCHDNFRLKKD